MLTQRLPISRHQCYGAHSTLGEGGVDACQSRRETSRGCQESGPVETLSRSGPTAPWRRRQCVHLANPKGMEWESRSVCKERRWKRRTARFPRGGAGWAVAPLFYAISGWCWTLGSFSTQLNYGLSYCISCSLFGGVAEPQEQPRSFGIKSFLLDTYNPNVDFCNYLAREELL